MKIGKLLSIIVSFAMVATVFAVAVPLAVPVNVIAEEPGGDPGLPEEPEIPEEPGMEGEGEWWVEGNGTYFELTNSTYLNITLTSSENVYIYLESIPRVVSYRIEADCATTSTEITIAGFEASKTYYRYQEAHLQEEFSTDEFGSYSYLQDISISHHVFIQEVTSTYTIRDDATGGDGYIIGNWNWPTKTLTLTTDVSETIIIASHGITLDGNGHSVIAGDGSYGVYVSARSGITITNVAVSGFSYGIYLYTTFGTITLSGNTVSGNYWGISLVGSHSSILRNNVMVSNTYNLHVYSIYSTQDIDTSNTVDGKPVYYWVGRSYETVPLDAGYVGIVDSDHITVQGLTLTKNYPGLLFVNTVDSTIQNVDVSGNNYGIHLVHSNRNTISGNTVAGNGRNGILLQQGSYGNIVSENTVSGNTGYGIHMFHSSGNTISGNTALGNGIGINLHWCGSNTISGNTVLNSGNGINLYYAHNNIVSGNTVSGDYSGTGIFLHGSNGNIVSGNTISEITNIGIYLLKSSNNIISGNTVSGNRYGLWLNNANDNTIFHNNIIDNIYQLYSYPSTNIWDNGAGEGNFWSDYVGEDLDNDGVGDTNLPHQNVDWHPLMGPWSPDPVDAIGKLKKYIEGLEIHHGTKNSLISQLNAAENALSNGNTEAAVNILNAFINHVQAAKKSGKLTQEQADYIISSAQKIIEIIEGE